MNYFYKKNHPEIFQGDLNKKNYYEGWYIKNVSADRKNIVAFIPGISLSSDKHAFIQVNDSSENKAFYLRFPIEKFTYDPKEFNISIDDNTFNKDYCKLKLKGEDISVEGKLEFSKHTLLPKDILNPGIMGWYSYVPFMESKHGVVSIDHSIKGSLKINQKNIDFTNGKGYIEKDWGTSFPEDYLWLQCNNFADPTISLMLSVAKIPWLGKPFIGFLGFLKVDDQIHRFATYNRSKILELREADNKNIKITIQTKKFIIEIVAEGKNFKELKSPLKGEMSGMIKESITTSVNLIIQENKKTILEDKGFPAGFEVHNKILNYFN